VSVTTALSSTQIGAIGENVVANELMKQSKGRLSPFYSIADDDGIDLLVYDKQSGRAVPVQVKTRTTALKKAGTQDRGNQVYFEVRKSALREYDLAHLVAVLLSEDLATIRCAWFIPMKDVAAKARKGKDKFVVVASMAEASKDRFTSYRCASGAGLAARVIAALEGSTAVPKPARRRLKLD
jgi:hypothetical protein